MSAKESFHPDWLKNAVIYQLNLRHFTPEGDLSAASGHISRLKSLGVDIIYLMPIHPIGAAGRKGPMGSPYAVKDHFALNPDLGSLDQFRKFVDLIHQQDMKIIIDWVANHTSKDHKLNTDHPEYYLKNHAGKFKNVDWWDWDDIYSLDYSLNEVWTYMINAMKYWVLEMDIDGFRCDTAGLVPARFWERARNEIEKSRKILMLAEWESRDLHERAFDICYAWTWYDAVFQRINCGGSMEEIYEYYAVLQNAWPSDALKMTFVTNHDKNAWAGNEFELFHRGLEAAIVLSMTGEGVPLIFNGQEAGNEKVLPLFEKTHIVWKNHHIGDLYRTLIHLKKTNSALWNSPYGGKMREIKTNNRDNIISFSRSYGSDSVTVFINFSHLTELVELTDMPEIPGLYMDLFTEELIDLQIGRKHILKPYGYKVLLFRKNNAQ